MRRIQQVIPAQKVNMGGIFLDQPLPTNAIDSIDPFLLIHHWKNEMPGNQKPQQAGVGPHPHRGFSPVTFIYQGAVHHRDSRGNDSIVRAGGTQWMDAGMGITHSERPPAELAASGGPFEIIQFWVNTPSAFKMEQPRYQPLQAEDTPMVLKDNGKTKIGVITGGFEGTKGPIETYFPMLILRISMEAESKIELDIPEAYNLLTYQLHGHSLVNGDRHTADKNMVIFEKEGGKITFESYEPTEIMLLSGLPIGEKVSQYGPFVMNTQTEVLEAMRDAQMGKMGVLIEEF